MSNIMRTIGRYLMVLTAGGMLAACSTTQKPVVVTPSAVEGKTWVLSSLDGEPPVDGARVTLEFKPASATEGKVNGHGPCNGYFGGYSIQDKVIRFTPMGSTMMACAEPVMKQEMSYLTAFHKLDRMTMSGQTLMLSDRDGNRQLTFMSESAHIRGQVKSSTGSFPGNSQMRVRLQDVSRQDDRAITLGEETIKLNYEVKGPVAFDLAYAPHLIRKNHDYAISVEVRKKGQLVYINKSRYPVDLEQTMRIRAEPVH
ncbi:MAG: META domain-containing protein [Endozoicomonas sp.]